MAPSVVSRWVLRKEACFGIATCSDWLSDVGVRSRLSEQKQNRSQIYEHLDNLREKFRAFSSSRLQRQLLETVGITTEQYMGRRRDSETFRCEFVRSYASPDNLSTGKFWHEGPVEGTGVPPIFPATLKLADLSSWFSPLHIVRVAYGMDKGGQC